VRTKVAAWDDGTRLLVLSAVAALCLYAALTAFGVFPSVATTDRSSSTGSPLVRLPRLSAPARHAKAERTTSRHEKRPVAPFHQRTSSHATPTRRSRPNPSGGPRTRPAPAADPTSPLRPPTPPRTAVSVPVAAALPPLPALPVTTTPSLPTVPQTLPPLPPSPSLPPAPSLPSLPPLPQPPSLQQLPGK
jgi:hypothetical protein